MQEQMFEDYFKSVAWLESHIKPKSKSYMKSGLPQDFFLERTQKLFNALGNPEKNFKIIHVAGTAGKGSTAHMIYSILNEADFQIASYLSPHVTTALERVHVKGQLISPKDFAKTVEQIKPVVQEIIASDPENAPSYSEIFFSSAMQHFSNVGCEWIVIETGCGGRFDMTNIIPAPEISIITNIGLDHCEVLGNTKEEIAWHKAGIIKTGSKVFSGETTPKIKKILDKQAEQTNLKINHSATTEVQKTAMPGLHQNRNANLAAAAAKYLGINSAAIDLGILAARLPARIELMQSDPRVIIDGAHSAIKIAALVKTLQDFKPWGKLNLIFAAKESNDLEELLRPLLPIVDNIYITHYQLPGFGSHSLEKTAKTITKLNPNLTTHIYKEAKPLKALEKCLANSDNNDLILATGSLYLAGEIRQYWVPETTILEHRSSFPPI